MQAELTEEERAHIRNEARKTFISYMVQSMVRGCADNAVQLEMEEGAYRASSAKIAVQLYTLAEEFWKQEEKLRYGE